MKQNQINRAYQTLSKMANMQLPVRVAYDLFMMLRQLEPAYKCELELERKLIEKYSGIIQNDGSISFQSLDNTEESMNEARKRVEGFGKEISELNDTEAPIDITPITISYEAMEGQTLTPADMACLDGFVVFV